MGAHVLGGEAAGIEDGRHVDGDHAVPIFQGIFPRGFDRPVDAGVVHHDVDLAELGDALKPYREAHYKEASEALAGLGERYPKAVEPLFYRGVSRLLLDDAAGALGLLEQARKIGGEALSDDILWYLAVARERTGNWSESSALLKALCSNEGANRADACSGLNPK